MIFMHVRAFFWIGARLLVTLILFDDKRIIVFD